MAVISAVLGAAMGIVRIFEVREGYDASGLAIAGDVNRLILIVCTLVFVAAAAVLSFGLHTSERRNSPRAFTHPSRAISLVYFISMCLFAATALFMILGCIGSFSAPTLISGFLLFFACAGMILLSFLLAKAIFPQDLSFVALIPTFWACYQLILSFRAETQNPVMSAYIFEISALVFMVLMFFFQAGMLYNRKILRRTYFATAVCLFLCTLCGVSKLVLGISEISAKAVFFDKVALLVPGFMYFGGAIFAVYVLLCLLREHVDNTETEK
ncbi:MAG: hypothetical protein IJC53_07430 [Clostridia bacterium]|nr:hypothetical protein [Clostridia bacterium]